MTDKEQIIIHGEQVPVITLTRRQLEEDWYTLHQQLTSKTQECEELKEKFKKFFNIDNQECWDIAFLKDENARYHKVLKEIEAVCRADTYTFADGTQVRYDSLDDILDIINKAKGEE